MEKYHWYSHPSSWYKRVPRNGYDGFGCTGQSCIPECRFYRETGRIEDSEVIQKHREREKRYRDNNATVEPPHHIPTIKKAIIRGINNVSDSGP
jgi:hypothetical protein